MKKLPLFVASLLVPGFFHQAGAQEMQPGLYTSTVTMEMTDGKKQVTDDQDCITPKDIADGLTRIGIEADTDCKIQNFAKDNGRITYRLACEDGSKKLLSDVVGTYTTNSYEFTIKPASSGVIFKLMSVKGKRLGVCK
ncbi:MAG: DUF3617 family protein [Betaproteobacteria bacterium]|nr:DUF3617 family protein [Betaproteobacteria bacterium]